MKLLPILLLLSAPAFAQTTTATTRPARTADAIVAELEASKPPAVDREKAKEPAYRAEYQKANAATIEKRAALALELWKAAPEDPRAFKYMTMRWMVLQRVQANTVLAEIGAAVDGKKLSVPQQKIALQIQAGILINASAPDAEQGINEFIAVDKADPIGADLLFRLALLNARANPEKSSAIYERIVAEYPTAPVAAKAKVQLQVDDKIGKPFEFSFTDAISGKAIKSADLKGKIVIVDFWATWCVPCVAEMPKVKKVYEQYKDKGVEVVGISLDEPEADGGLKKLKAFVAKNEIPWPQWYTGAVDGNDFSKAAGAISIPRIFVIDADGNLAENRAVGRLDQIISEMIAKRDAKK